MERVFRPRWPTPFRARQRIVGAVVLLLGLTLLVPIPLSNVIPAVAVMLIALAYLEEDGLMLAVGMTAGCLSLAITAAMVWGAMAGIGLLNRL